MFKHLQPCSNTNYTFNLTEVLNNRDFSYLSMLENMHDKNSTKQGQHIGNKRRVEVDFRITVETIKNKSY